MTDTELINKTYAEAIDTITFDMLSGADDGSMWYAHIIGLPDHLRITYLVAILQQQVAAGGFDQYFVNSYGQFAPQTIAALLEIGAQEISTLLQQAYTKANSGGLSQDNFRRQLLSGDLPGIWAQTEADEQEFEALSDQYKKSKEDAIALLGQYLSRTISGYTSQ